MAEPFNTVEVLAIMSLNAVIVALIPTARYRRSNDNPPGFRPAAPEALSDGRPRPVEPGGDGAPDAVPGDGRQPGADRVARRVLRAARIGGAHHHRGNLGQPRRR